MAQVYVAPFPEGNDGTGLGTMARPYATIAKGYSMTGNGGTLNIKGGLYPQSTGIIISKPITIKKWAGTPGQVVIDATGLAFSPGVPFVVAIVNTTNVVIDSVTLQNGIYSGAKGFWVLNDNNSTTRSRNITIKNCTIENIGWIKDNLSKRPATSSIGTNAILVECYRSISMNSIYLLNNHVKNCATGWGEAVTVTGNVDTFYIEDNIVHHIANIGIAVAGNYASTTAPAPVNQARNGFVRRNTVYNCMSGRATSAGIYLDGSLNCTVERNTVYQCGAGISVGAEEIIPPSVTVGGHKIINNLAYSNALAGMFLGSGTAGNEVKRSQVINNTFYRNVTAEHINGVDSIGPTEAELQPVAAVAGGSNGDILLFNSDSLIFQNNIIQPLPASHAFTGMGNKTMKNFNSNYNLFYRTGSTPLFRLATGHSFNGVSTGGTEAFYSGVPAFTAATGSEVRSVSGNPDFSDPAANVFTLKACSFAINRGNPDSASLAGSFDRNGNARVVDGRIDCGAYEYPQPALPCSFILQQPVAFCNSLSSEIKLTWTTSANAASYDIYRNGTLYKTNIADTQYTDNSLPSVSVYRYLIKAKNNNDPAGVKNANDTLSIQAFNCSQPGIFTLSQPEAGCNGTASQIKLTWTVSANANYYAVYRNALLYKDSIIATQYIDAGILPGTTYKYIIKAKNTHSASTRNNMNDTLSAVALNCAQPGVFTLAAPVTACNGATGLVRLTWAPAANANYYAVYKNGVLHKDSITVTQYVDSPLTAGVVYKYIIKAKNTYSGTAVNNVNDTVTVVGPDCITTGINDPANNPFAIHIFPNPSGGKYYFTVEKVFNKPIRLEVFTLAGQKVYTYTARSISNNFTGSVQITQPGGLYFAKFTIDKAVHTLLLVKTNH